MILVSELYQPSRNQIFVNDETDNAVSLFEVSGTNYVPGFGGSGRKLLANKSLLTNSGTHKEEFHFDNISWFNLNLGLVLIGGAVIIREVTDDTDSLLVMFRSNGLPVRVPGAEFRIEVDINGYFTF